MAWIFLDARCENSEIVFTITENLDINTIFEVDVFPEEAEGM